MRRPLLAAAILLFAAAPAHARLQTAGRALGRAAEALTAPTGAPCPADVPTQAITVVNQAHISPLKLDTVERALVDQSVQLHDAWGTPCVQFAPGGWPLYLEPNIYGWAVHYPPGDTGQGTFVDDTACSHRPDTTLPCALVSASHDWTINASHELVEMLADPSAQGEEICDPVERWAYRLDGAWVSDFVFPADSGRYDEIGRR